VVAAAAYLPTLANGFAFDDDVVIVRNRLLASLARLPELLGSTEWTGAGLAVRAWRPLTALTYALNHAAAGLAPWPWHLVNLLIHAAVAAAVAALGRTWGLSVRAAGLGALLFALHPIHVEPVANVVGRKDLLAAGFVVAMALGHRWAGRGGGWRVLAPAGAFLAACLSKEVGVVGVGLVALQDLLRPDTDRPGARGRGLYAAYLAVAGGYLVAYRAVTGDLTAGLEVPFIDNPLAYVGAALRVASALVVMGEGLLLQLTPWRQSPDWSFPAIRPLASMASPALVLAVAALAAWAVAGLWLWRRRGRSLPLLALGWYLLALLPASNLLFASGTAFGERLLYLPSVAVALLGGAGLEAALARWRAPATVAAALLLAALGLATVRYELAWRDDPTLFAWAERHGRPSAKVALRLGQLRLAGGDPGGALEPLGRAAQLLPGYHRTELALGSAYRTLGQLDLARAHLEVAHRLERGDAATLGEMGRLARDGGDLVAAERWWREAAAADPGLAATWDDLGTLALVRGDLEAARSSLARAVALDPGLVSAWYNLGLVARAQGDRPGARAAFERFLALAGPSYPDQTAEVRRWLASDG